MKVSNNDIYFVFTQSTSPGWALKSAVCSNGTVTNSLKERFIASGFYNHCKVFWPGIQIKCIKPISLSVFVWILAEEKAFIPNRKADADTTKTRTNVIITGDMCAFTLGVFFISSFISNLLFALADAYILLHFFTACQVGG